jgi:predicted DsbA family dithiol-disulfide isomerase
MGVMSSHSMTIEIWSDIVCPWCYIGKRRFESALGRFAHRDQVQVVWRSFELDPRAPRRSPGTLNDMLARKIGVSLAQAAAMHAEITALAAKEGLDYQLDRAKPGNTFDAHRLIHLAAAHNLQGKAKERLLQAYFTDGLAIGDSEALRTLGTELGLPADEVREMLEGDTYADEVRAARRRAAALGISGVPFYVIDERCGVSGAQAPSVFLDALNRAWAESDPLKLISTLAAEVGSCEDSSCALAPARGTAEFLK